MTIRTRPLFAATALGAGILIFYYLLSGIAASFMVGRMLDSPLFDPAFINEPSAEIPFDPDSTDPFEFMFNTSAETFAILGLCLGLGSCVLWLGAGLGAGAFYTVRHHREEALVDAPVKGGAAAGALAYVIGTLLGSFITLITVAPLYERISTIFSTLAATDPTLSAGFPSEMLLMWGVSFVASLICSTLFWGLMGAAFGAVGSAIGKSFIRTEPPAAGLI